MASGTRREIAVGALTLLGVVLFFAGTLVLKGGNLGGGRQWTVIFADVNGLKRGSPVQISGYAVGHVTDIKLTKPGEVAVEFVLPDDMPLQSDAVIQVGSVGLVGDVLLRVDPGRSPTTLDPATPIQGSAQSPGFTAQAEALGEQVGEADLVDAELVVPGVAEDPEVVAAFLLVVPSSGRTERVGRSRWRWVYVRARC